MKALEKNDRDVIDVVTNYAGLIRVAPRLETAEAYAELARQLIQLRVAQEYVSNRKDQILDPLKSLKATAKEWFGGVEADLVTAEATAKAMLVEYIDRRVLEAAAEVKESIESGDMALALSRMTAVPAVTGLTLRSETDFEVVDATDIPDEYFKPRELDGVKIRKALKQGLDVPGVVHKSKTSLAISTTAQDKS